MGQIENNVVSLNWAILIITLSVNGLNTYI